MTVQPQPEHEQQWTIFTKIVRVTAPITMDDDTANQIVFHHVEYLFDDAAHKLNERLKEFNPELTLVTEI